MLEQPDRPAERIIACLQNAYGLEISQLAFLYERIVEDLAVYCEQLLLTDAGGADREQLLGSFMGNVEPGSVLEIAYRADRTPGAG